MIVSLSDAASNAMLDTISNMMDGGRIELLSEDSLTLAVLKLSDPAARQAVGGELEFNKIAEEDAALGQGRARSARIFTAKGGEVFTCDVSDAQGDGVIRLNTIEIFPGGPVRIKSFRLVMP